MKAIINTLPGYRVFEYLLVLNPHAELRQKIWQVRQEFQEKFEVAGFLGGQPQVTLARFSQYEMMEERIMNRLKLVAMGYPPFKVELKDYGSLPSHSIYINVLSKVAMQGLVRQLRTETQRLMKLNEENKPYFVMEPMLPIARKLQPWQYERGWLEYSHKHFTGRFIADSMLLLKRPAGEMKYQVINRFEFQNMPVTTRQGELFG